MTQEEALTILKTGANVFLTGEPGSGKSHTINRYVAYLRDRGVEPAITASTGIAATHIGGLTIHSWSGIGIRRTLTPYDLDEISNRERLAKRIASTHVLIIDEISMLPARALSMVDQVLRTIKRKDSPFGGVQVILVGDFFQLPPVVKREEMEGGLFEGEESKATFAFDSSIWERLNPITCYLEEQHRQEDAQYLALLTALRAGDIDRSHEIMLEGRILEEEARSALSIPKLFTHNIDVDRINEGELAKLEGTIRSFVMEGKGSPGIVEALKRGCLSPEVLGLKIGTKVMFTKNDFDEGYVNGTLGTVIGFEKIEGHPIVETLRGEEIIAKPVEWSVADGGKVLAKITQVPLRLAWALTVHKSQGMSLDAAFMDLSQAFEYGQGYVALSRVRSLNGLYLGGMNDKALKVHPQVQKKDSLFKEHSKEARRVFKEMEQGKLDALHLNFLNAIGAELKPQNKSKKKAGSKNTGYLAKIRETHPKANMRWTEDEEQRLRNQFEEGLSINELSSLFERKPGGIISRLKKLGLIEEDYSA